MKRKLTFIIALITVIFTHGMKAGATAPPSFGGGQATVITATTATFSASILSQNLLTTVRFNYATNINDLVSNYQTVFGNSIQNLYAETSSASVTGLAPSTTYLVRVWVSNADGTALTQDFTFKTDASVTPTVSGFSVSDLNTSKAFINYSVANGNATTVVKYGTNANNLDNTLAGTAGSAPYNGKVALTGLMANTQYYYAVEATNTNGTVVSPTQNFTTPSTDLISEFTFNNTLANTSATSTFSAGTFINDRFGNTNSGIACFSGVNPQAAVPNIPIGKSDRTISFWFRMGAFKTHPANDQLFGYGSNASNQKFGAYLNGNTLVFQSWTTDLPAYYLFAATWNHITLVLEDNNIKVYINGNTPIINTNVPNLNTGNNNVFTFTGTTGGTFLDDLKIYNRAVTPTEVESLRLNNDLIASVLTPTIADVTTTNIELTSGLISYTLNANNANTTSLVKYGTEANNLTSSMAVANIAGNSVQARTVSLTALTNGTTYYYSIEATNSNGTTTSTGNFSTLGITAPTITNVTNGTISTSYGNVSYTLTPNNGSVTSKVRYGLQNNNLDSEVTGFTASGSTVTTMLVPVPNLMPNTTYHYQIEATNSAGTVTSTISTFTTRATITPTVEFDFDGNTEAKNNAALKFNVVVNYGVNRANVAGKSLSTGLGFPRSVAIPNNLLPTGNSDRTISMWYAINSFNNNYSENMIFTYGQPLSKQQFIYTVSPPYSNWINIGFSGVGSSAAQTFAYFNWNHVVVTMQAEVVKVYLNNQLKITYNGTGMNTAFTNFAVGNFNGLLDEIKIFDVALSASEVAALNASTLPVNLITYTAKAQNKTTDLIWKTASESNNSHFLVNRSNDGVHFTQLAKVNATSSNVATYSYKDTDPLNGVNYYQLLQVDNDGATTDLGVKSVNFSLNNTVSVYPNPTTDKLYINDTSNSFNAAKIYDAQGKIVLSTSLKSGSSIDVSALVKGVYFIKLSGNSNDTKKFIKL